MEWQSRRPGASPHRAIFEEHGPSCSRVVHEFGNEAARNVVLFNRPEPSVNQASQPCGVARRVDVSTDDPRPEDRQARETDRLHGFFLQSHDARIADPAPCVAAHGR